MPQARHRCSKGVAVLARRLLLSTPMPTSSLEVVPEILLPVQLGDRHSGGARPAEHRLMLAVLEDAVHTYQRARGGGGRPGGRLFRETEAWFASDETDSPFAFVTICEVWDLDPDYIRTGLRRWHSRRDVPVLPWRIRRVSGSRHQVTLIRAARRKQRCEHWDQ